MVRIEQVGKEYITEAGTLCAVKKLSLHLPPGSMTTLLGRSGCGKTTLLRMIAGLETLSSGRIERNLSFQDMGYVFQEPRLMPWLTVEENICFVTQGGRTKNRNAGDLSSILKSLGLQSSGSLYPHQLSGGMAQRVALGRTLYCQPKLILMDEPFGALDWFTRRALQRDLLRLWQEGGRTVLLVTHDVDEALTLSQRIVIIRNGTLQNIISVDEAYPRRPEKMHQLREEVLACIDDEKM